LAYTTLDKLTSFFYFYPEYRSAWVTEGCRAGDLQHCSDPQLVESSRTQPALSALRSLSCRKQTYICASEIAACYETCCLNDN